MSFSGIYSIVFTAIFPSEIVNVFLQKKGREKVGEIEHDNLDVKCMNKNRNCHIVYRKIIVVLPPSHFICRKKELSCCKIFCREYNLKFKFKWGGGTRRESYCAIFFSSWRNFFSTWKQRKERRKLLLNTLHKIREKF